MHQHRLENYIYRRTPSFQLYHQRSQQSVLLLATVTSYCLYIASSK